MSKYLLIQEHLGNTTHAGGLPIQVGSGTSFCYFDEEKDDFAKNFARRAVQESEKRSRVTFAKLIKIESEIDLTPPPSLMIQTVNDPGIRSRFGRRSHKHP